MHTRLPLFFLLLLLTLFTQFAQQRKISVSYEKNSNDDYVFYAENNTSQRYTVVIYFNTLLGLNPDTKLPAVKIARQGRTRLFRLSKSGIGSPSFNWGWAYQKGTGNPKIVDFTYALPVAPEKQTQAIELSSLNENYGDGERPEGFYAIGFTLEEQDTIFASRGGKVISIDQSNNVDGDNMTFSRTRNKIEIEHEDGTIGSYSIFKANSAMVEVGEEILMGDPLALAGGAQYTRGHQVRLQVYALYYDKEAAEYSKDFFDYQSVLVKFKTTEGDAKILEGNIKYRGYIDDEMITQEMSKRQKKRYLKQRKN